MSIPSNRVTCTGCSFEATRQYRPISLLYRLREGVEAKAGRSFGWCHECGTIRDVESALDATAIEDSLRELRSSRTPLRKLWRTIARRLGAADSSDEGEERNLEHLLLIAGERKSEPRCLVCGSEATKEVHFNQSGLSDFAHECGGYLRMEPPDPNAPRFFFRPALVELDGEGRRLE